MRPIGHVSLTSAYVQLLLCSYTFKFTVRVHGRLVPGWTLVILEETFLAKMQGVCLFGQNNRLLFVLTSQLTSQWLSYPVLNEQIDLISTQPGIARLPSLSPLR